MLSQHPVAWVLSLAGRSRGCVVMPNRRGAVKLIKTTQGQEEGAWQEIQIRALSPHHP